MSTEFITNREIYDKVIQERIPFAEKFVWIGTSDMKDLYVKKKSKMVPFLEILNDLVKKGVEIRVIHAKEPGEAYRSDYDKYPLLIKGMEMLLCPRVHFKIVIVDGKFAYTGSANLTGAGMGSKSDNRRNFENGFITSDKVLVNSIMSQFDEVWMGKHCKKCDRKQFCFEHL
ncbi:MAG: phospholipase [Candidatus Delongbacteria bacterium]|nr:phospholipase [Candidatus Delongbacteria bacterium]MCG2760730.1 phospholipase D-like domain-containing protein [Candidatus Delongbacteria bacterium]